MSVYHTGDIVHYNDNVYEITEVFTDSGETVYELDSEQLVYESELLKVGKYKRRNNGASTSTGK